MSDTAAKLWSVYPVFWELLRQEWRDRQRGTALGALWLLLPALFMLLVYGLVFGAILQMRVGSHTEPLHFAAWLFAGLLPFNALAEVLVRAPTLLVERRALLLNTPLPVWVLPLPPVAMSVLLELLAVALLGGWLCWQGDCPTWGWVWYLPFLLVRLLLTLALAYPLAVLGVFVRDLRQALPPALTVLLLFSAIVYPLEVVPPVWQQWLGWNPLTQLVAGYRAALLDGTFLWQPWLALLLLALALLAVGLGLFRHGWRQARYVL